MIPDSSVTTRARHGRHTLRLRRLVFGALVLAFAMGSTAYGQAEPPEDQPRRPLSPESKNNSPEGLPLPLHSPQAPVNCEIAGRYIDDAVMRAVREKGTHLIVIIRPGAGESSPRLNRMRVAQVTAYMEYIRLSNYAIATGEKARGDAHLEIYVGGKLLYTLPIRKNQGLDLLSCVAV